MNGGNVMAKKTRYRQYAEGMQKMYTKLYTHKLFMLKMVVIFLILTSITLATQSCQEQEPAYVKDVVKIK